MNLELLVIPLIFVLSIILAKRDKRSALTMIMILSLFLHKEVFSIYRWDVLPIRIFMLGLTAYIAFSFLNWLLKAKSFYVAYDTLHEYLSDPFIVSLTLLWFIRGLSIIFTRNLAASVFLFGFFTTIVALGYYTYTRFRNDSDGVLSLIKAYIKLAFIACLFGYLQIFLYYKYNFIIGAFWNIPERLPRVGSVFWDVNHFGAFLAALMPVLGILIVFAKTWKNRLLNSLMFFVMLSILLITNSRTAWIAAFFSFLIFSTVLLIQKYKMKGIVGVLLTVIILTLPVFHEYSDKSSPFRAKVKDYFHYRIDSFDSHLLLLRGTFAVFEDYPVLGGGYGGFFEHFIRTDVASEYLGRDPAGLNTRVPAHTIWGEQLSETGIVGTSAYIFLMFTIVGTIFYASFNLSDTKQRLLTNAMGSALMGWLIGGVFYSYKSEFFWLIFFLYFIYAISLLKAKFLFQNVVSFYFRSKYWPPIIVGAISFILIFWGLGSTHLIPWDEAIYAKVAKNMVLSGNYLDPHWWPNLLWFEKPPLLMWFMSFFINLFGLSSWAVRLPSAIFGFLTVLLTYKFGTKLYNKTVGVIAGLVLVTTFQFLYYSRAAMMDVSLTFFVTLALYYYWNAGLTLKNRYWILSGLSIGFGVMIKGVVGFLPFLVIAVHQLILIFSKKQKLDMNLVKGMTLSAFASLVIFMPWHIYMYIKFGYPFIQNYIGYHVLERATHGIEDKGRPWYWYFTVLKVSMRIWYVALLVAFPVSLLTTFTSIRKFVIKNTPFGLYSYMKDLFIVVYAVTIFAFFAIAKSKLVWYIIPIYPATSIIVGLFIERIVRLLAPKSIIKKSLILYLIFVVGLFYLFLEKKLVYTGDLTYKQAELIQEKDLKYGVESKLYADRIELPLLLYYSDGPFEVVDFGPLQEILSNAKYTESVIFITKESRFRAFSADHPDLQLDAREDEWVLGYKPSMEVQDLKLLSELEGDIETLKKEIQEDKEKGNITPPATYTKLDKLQRDASSLDASIEANRALVALSVENESTGNSQGN